MASMSKKSQDRVRAYMATT